MKNKAYCSEEFYNNQILENLESIIENMKKIYYLNNNELSILQIEELYDCIKKKDKIKDEIIKKLKDKNLSLESEIKKIKNKNLIQKIFNL